ncbi:putative reverse transcriptase zinc-binding domain-containing protein [Helianthus annuus]|nr:putative reverse transcriptase zinc-binding domain-containing protein [Helianthus annuus]
MLLGRFSTADMLFKSDITSSMSECKLCDKGIESIEHLFTSCYVVSIVWQQISVCCNIPPLFVFSAKDILSIHKQGTGSTRRRKLLHTIMLVACWSIWNARNKLIFEEVMVRVEMIIGDVKSLSFLWIRTGSKVDCMD